jgi:putative ABC transport system permease protein
MSPVDSILSFSTSAFVAPLLVAIAVATGALSARGLTAPHLARIGLRNAPRRWGRTLLIVFGLMLATTFIASSLAIDDTITLAVRSVAVFNLGRVDEDVTGGQGPLGLYPSEIGAAVAQTLSKDARVADVAPALVAQNTLVADTTAREVRGGVAALSIASAQSGVFGDLRDTRSGATRSAVSLEGNDAFLDQPLAIALNARVNDRITLYSTLWPGKRYSFIARGIVTGGPLGDAPAVILSLNALQTITGSGDRINHIYIANVGNGLTGVDLSDDVASEVNTVLPGFVHITEVKLNGVNFALHAQELFGRILTLYTLFALAIGLLLIFLIFTLLAAERRAELGVARALGMRRGQLVWTLLFEGAAYDLAAAGLGVLSGLGLGLVILALASPTLKRIGFPLQFALNPDSVIVAFALGLLFTLLTIAVAAWSVSYMTIAAALRDLPEPPAPAPTLLELVEDTLATGAPIRRRLAVFGAMSWQLVARGPAPLALGYWLVNDGATRADTLEFALGVSLTLTGVALLARALGLALTARFSGGHDGDKLLLLARARLIADRLCALAIGCGLALYWSLPFDALVGIFGLPRFNGGIQIFFIAGVMMIFGCALALAPNLDLLLIPLRIVGSLTGRLRHVTRIALVYPAQQRFRTGIGLTLFAFVLFTMTVMDCIAASTTRSYDDLPAQAASYDIAGQPLFTSAGGVASVARTLRQAQPATAAQITATGEATPLALGFIQPGARSAAWRFYPASVIQGSLLDGVGLPLVARATGYASDSQVWQAVRTQPGDVVIDSSALSPPDAATLGLTPAPPPGAAQFIGPPIAAGLPGFAGNESLYSAIAAPTLANANENANGAENASGSLLILSALLNDQGVLNDYTLRLSNLAIDAGRIAPTTVWVADVRGGPAVKLTVIGVVENSRGATYGALGSPQTFAPVERGLAPVGGEYYYFKLQSGADAHAMAYSIGSALINDGFETAVLQDALLDVNGARVFISQALVGLVGLTLLVGMAALAVSGSRAVIERRQQIGMLRALGFHRLDVQIVFLIESLVVGMSGALLGTAFGLILCRNIFAVDFFEQYQSGLSLIVPWRDIGLIVLAAMLASIAAALLPAWQAGRVAPADALRYE